MSNYPAVKMSLLFIAGILLQHFLQLGILFLCISLFFVVTFLFVSIKTTGQKNRLKNVSVLLAVLLTGALINFVQNVKRTAYPFELAKLRNYKITGTVESIDIIGEKKLSFILLLKSFGKNHFDETENYKFETNIWKDTTNKVTAVYEKLLPGNTIEFTGTIKRAKNRRNPNEFDYEKYLYSKGICGVINCYEPESIVVTNNRAEYFGALVFRIRKAIDERIKKLHDEKTAAVLKGLILADRSDIDYVTKKYFINAGVIHVLAVSGLHVGFIAMIFFVLFARFGIKYQYTLTIIGIIFFLILTGNHPSVFRASVMAVTYLIAKLTNRTSNGINSLAIAALIILTINSNELFNPGFLLSFTAVLSILILYPVLAEKIYSVKINNVLRNLLLFLSVTIVAQLGTLPLTVIYFNKISIVSLLANIIVIPLTGFIVATGIFTLLLSVVSVWFATYFAAANILFVHSLLIFVYKVSQLSFSYVHLYNFSLFDSIFFYFFLGLIFFAVKKFKNALALTALVFISIFSFFNFMDFYNKSVLPESELTLTAIDVDQGDAFLLKFPDGKAALIDAGNRTKYFDNGEFVILPLLKTLSIDTLDYVFISHLDSDHFAGIVSLIDMGLVKHLFKPIGKGFHKDEVFENYLKKNKVQLTYYSKTTLNIGGAKLYILNDTTDNIYQSFDANNKSGIIKLVYGNTSFLFTGDLGKKGERYLINKYGKFLHSDVLKVGHHGSNTSSSDEFIETVKPEIAIISAGVLNKFHHPSVKVLRRLMKRKIKIRRTDKEGAIILASNGSRIKNVNWKQTNEN